MASFRIQINTTNHDLNVRAQPNTNSSIVGKLKSGTIYDIETFRQSGSTAWQDWMYVETSSFSGYVSCEFLIAHPYWNGENGTIRVGDYVNIRRKASTSSASIGRLRDGDKVTVLETYGDWVRIACLQGIGWVHKDYIIVD